MGPQLRLPPAPSSVRRARDEAGGAIGGWGNEESREVALLLLSEVVTNGVLHARSELTVSLSVVGECLRVEVEDASPDPPVRRLARADTPGGRGLVLLDELADSWGVNRTLRGKAVWFELSPDGSPAT